MKTLLIIGLESVPEYLEEAFDIEFFKGFKSEEVFDYALVMPTGLRTNENFLSSLAWRIDGGMMIFDPTFREVLELKRWFNKVRFKEYGAGTWAVARYSKCADRRRCAPEVYYTQLPPWSIDYYA